MSPLQGKPDGFEPLPWQTEIWRRLWQARRSQRLPHALLFTGQAGMGKGHFARCLAQALFCERPADHGVSCGLCHNCRLFATGSHPDYHLIAPAQDAKTQEIKVDAIRDLIERGVLTSSSGGQKVILIAPADHMNTAAANSLLKTLEEPVSSTLLILLTSQPNRLPATVRSRCQRSEFSADRARARSWLVQHTEHPRPGLLLDLAGGAPLYALAMAQPEVLRERATMLSEFENSLHGRQDPLAVAERWAQLEPLHVLNWISGWVLDMLRLRHSPGAAPLFNTDQRETLATLAEQVEPKGLYRLLDEVLAGRREATSTLGKQFMLESILITWVECKGN